MVVWMKYGLGFNYSAFEAEFKVYFLRIGIIPRLTLNFFLKILCKFFGELKKYCNLCPTQFFKSSKKKK